MGRQRIIDREKVLEAAEEIVINQGATALTIDAVAKAMGISKGGVQYCFGNKDALIDAMFERWASPMMKFSIKQLNKITPLKGKFLRICKRPTSTTKSRWQKALP